MADYIEVGNYRVDRMSQKMLVAMDDGPKRATELMDQADINNYGKLSHRMDNQLKPAGLVDEMNTVQRKFRLTDEGKSFVDDHNLEVRTLDEIRDVAVDARERTESLSGTVGSLSSKVDDLEEKDHDIEGIAEDVDEMQNILILPEDSMFNDRDTEVWLPERNLNTIEDQSDEIDELNERLDDLEEDLAEWKSESIDLKEWFQGFQDDRTERDEAVDQQIVELAERIEDLRDDLDELQEESISDLEEEIEEMQEGRLSSLFG